MFRPDPFLAGVRAGKGALCPNFRQQKTLLIAGQGRYSVRATGSPTKAPVALRNPPKP